MNISRFIFMISGVLWFLAVACILTMTVKLIELNRAVKKLHQDLVDLLSSTR